MFSLLSNITLTFIRDNNDPVKNLNFSAYHPSWLGGGGGLCYTVLVNCGHWLELLRKLFKGLIWHVLLYPIVILPIFAWNSNNTRGTSATCDSEVKTTW